MTALLIEWTAAHNGVLLGLLLLCVLALLAMVRRAMLRQRTISDDVNVNVGRALAKHATKARYTYRRRSNGGVEFDWDDVDEGFPLDWRTGFLTGRTLDEMIPAGPGGDEARAVYESVLTRRLPGIYLRPETAPDGRTVLIRYTHVPMPDGCGACEAVPLSPEIDAAVSEREHLAAENARLTDDLARLRAHYTQKTQQMAAERTLRAALLAPAGGGTP